MGDAAAVMPAHLPPCAVMHQGPIPGHPVLPGPPPGPPTPVVSNGLGCPQSPEPMTVRSPGSQDSQVSIASQMLTIRMLMSGKEVGSIIGKKGDNVKKYREESCARINISDGSCPERIVTVTGTVDQIHIAFSMMCQKFEDDFTQSMHRAVGIGLAAAAAAAAAAPQMSSSGSMDDVTCPPVTLRLLVPATQCGSIIGKGGCKIKEIRELTGASIQVASEVLPNSSERTVTISGTAKAIAKCIRLLCHILLESPAKGATIPYRPKPVMLGPPMPSLGGVPPPGQLLAPAAPGAPLQFPPELSKAGGAGMPPYAAMAGDPILAAGCLPNTQLALTGQAVMPSGRQGAAPPAATSTHEILVPNDLVGCIIGRGGTKINEIRQLSGAQIKISNCEDGTKDRKVSITGTAETIAAAQYLISTSIELHKQLLALNMAVSAGLAPLPMPNLVMRQPPVSTACGLPPTFVDFNALGPMLLPPGMAEFASLQLLLPPQPPQSPLTTKVKSGLAAQRKPKFAPY